MCIGAPAGRLGLRGAAARRSATWPLALVGLGATSHTCDTLWAIALSSFWHIIPSQRVCGVVRQDALTMTLLWYCRHDPGGVSEQGVSVYAKG